MTALVPILLLVTAPPSEVIFPAQAIPLRFSHAQHLKKQLACEYCHVDATESRVARDSLIPNEAACSDCHPIDRSQPHKQAKVAARCDACHPGWEGKGEPPRIKVPMPHLKFNHQVHAANGIGCEKCHGDMKKVDLATRSELPKMALCLRCHVGAAKAPSSCGTCHLQTPAGTLATSFAEGRLIPSGEIRGDAHTPGFKRDHANVARNDERYCLSCHRKNECLTCHNGVTKPMDFHGNDYVNLHAIDARRDSPRCQSCHRLQTFCVGCHQRTGVAFDPPSGQGEFRSSLRFHPPGWKGSEATPGFADNPNHHAWQAMRNIRSCASCHREETCVRCHSTFGDASVPSAYQRTNPHPPSWIASGRCRAIASRNQRVCLKCHVVRSAALDCVP